LFTTIAGQGLGGGIYVVSGANVGGMDMLIADNLASTINIDIFWHLQTDVLSPFSDNAGANLAIFQLEFLVKFPTQPFSGPCQEAGKG
jgi:hypothetical protein